MNQSSQTNSSAHYCHQQPTVQQDSELRKLVTWLRYGNEPGGNYNSIWHSRKTICSILGICLEELQNLLNEDDTSIRRQTANQTLCKQNIYFQSSQFAASLETLQSQFKLTLPQRVRQIAQARPDLSISLYKLRRIYKQQRIQQRKFSSKLQLTTKQLQSQQSQLKIVLPVLLDLIAQNKQVLFLDEAVFTTNQIGSKFWWKVGAEPPHKAVNCLSFNAVAVIAATDINGKLVGYLIKDWSIKKEDIVQFLRKIARRSRRARQYIFLDNLRAHHSKDVEAEAKKRNQTLLFNGSYSSQLNPIEILWAYAKRYFRKEMMSITDYKQTQVIHSLVEASIKQVSAQSLKNYTAKVIKVIQAQVTQQNLS